jgi:hypothetical protein
MSLWKIKELQDQIILALEAADEIAVQMSAQTVEEFKDQVILALEAVGEIARQSCEVGTRDEDLETVQRAIALVERYGGRAAFLMPLSEGEV